MLEKIKELRERSGAGMADCKKALVENSGDIEKSIDWLKLAGLAKAAKKASRDANEGLVCIANNETKAVIVTVNSETDFAARSEKFQDLCKAVTNKTLAEASTGSSTDEVKQDISEAVGVIGENIVLGNVKALYARGKFKSYVHNKSNPTMGSIAVTVDYTGNEEAAYNVAMHISATTPEAMIIEDLDPAILEREKAILTEKARASGKPDNIIEMMMAGRIAKYYNEIILMEQGNIREPEVKIKDYLKRENTVLHGYIFTVLGA